MIVFDLQCSQGHRFEGWFDDGVSFERQQRQGLVVCPVCEDTTVTRLPSRFGIKSSTGAPPPANLSVDELASLGRRIVDYVEKNFENVGAGFAEEALKMHYGVTEPRNIRGVSTPGEEKTLKAEGISFFKIPIPSEPRDPDAS